MVHKKMLFVSLLVCMGMGGVLSAEPPVSPWQVLNPPAVEPSSQFEVVSSSSSSSSSSASDSQDEYNDTPYEVTYEEAAFQNNTYEEEYYPTEEELLLANLPFKLPFKMDKKQMAVVIKLLKEAVKPIIKSKSLRKAVAYIDDTLNSYKSDLETQMYVTLLLDSVQEIYEGKETSELNMMMKRFFTDVTDEQTARTIGSMWSSYVSPMLKSYLYNPMSNYIISPVRSYLYDPVSNYVTDFADRIETWMQSSNRPYIDIQYPDGYSNWGERANSYAKSISGWVSQARQGLEMARRVLDLQEEGRSCGGCSGGDHVQAGDEIYSIQ